MALPAAGIGAGALAAITPLGWVAIGAASAGILVAKIVNDKYETKMEQQYEVFNKRYKQQQDLITQLYSIIEKKDEQLARYEALCQRTFG